jgi:LAS superfamily LD-carboxypeptidase LdcB
MALKIKYPVKRFVVPAELKKHGNGQIPFYKLKGITGGGKLWTKAADAWNAMAAHAAKDGIKLVNVSSGYRSLKSQEALFFDRYSLISTGRVPAVSRVYKGKKYWLKKGKSPSATPQKSVHGWGCAQDTNVKDTKVFGWLVRNAPKYGFYLQGQKWLPDGRLNPEWEPWHWQYCG